jgi:hypothetical protein
MKIAEFSHFISQIKSDNNIIVGQKSLFFASKDFNFMGVDILKDSLVSYNGENKVKVNNINFESLIELGLTTWDFIRQNIKFDIHSCLWLDGHFHTYGSSSLKKYFSQNIDNIDFPASSSAPFLDNITTMEIILYNDLEFSSIWYHFVFENEANLTNYINMSDQVVKSKTNNSLVIPPFVEIEKNNLYPLKEISILGIPTMSNINFYPETGRLTIQNISKDIETIRIDDNSGYKNIFRKNFFIEIDLDGIIYQKQSNNGVMENWRLKLADK